jgi:hypothetical protein
LLSAGALFRTESQDRKLAATEDVLVMAAGGYSTQLNKNDANNNFDTGLASMVYKVTPSLVVDFGGSFGLVASATAFYDSVIMGGGHDGGELLFNGCDPFSPCPVGGINRYASYSDYANNGTGDRFTDEARSEVGRRFRMLDAYVFTDIDVFDRPMNVRLGRQVINWGEALFIQNGINTANYIDLTALRLPGSEIKEALLPLASLYFNWGVTDNLSVESFYQFEWKNSLDAPAGTFWSTHDAFPGKGANNVIVDGRLVAASAGVPALADAFASYTLSTYGESGVDYEYEQTQVTVNRLADEQAKDGGQFGLAARYFSSLFGGTEFGAFYTRTHSRLPVVGARLDLVGAGTIPEKIDNARYFMVYNEDVDMFGASFSTNVGQMSLSGEMAYRPKQLIINEVGDNLLQSLSGLAANPAPTVGNITPHCVRDRMGGPCLDPGTAVVQGQEYYFYEEVETITSSLVGIYSFGPMIGANNVISVLELGMDYVVSGLRDGLRYNSTAAILSGEALIQHPDDPNKTFLTEGAWGYRAIVQADYNDIFAGITMKPSIRIAHDVQGNSPIGGNFLEDRKAATLGVDFVYLNNLEVGIQATSFWGNGYSNKLSDRNNASLALKYAF